MARKNYLIGLAVAGALATSVAKGDYFSDRDRTQDTNNNARIGFVTNSYKFDETAAKIESGDELALWIKDHPSSNEYVTGHRSAFGYNNGDVFKILTQTSSYTNLEAGTVYVTQNSTGKDFKQPVGVLFRDESKNRLLNTKLTGENNTLNITNYTYVLNGSTNITSAGNHPNWSGIPPGRYTFHNIPDGTNTVTLQTHYEPVDIIADAGTNDSWFIIPNHFKLGSDGIPSWSSLKKGDEFGAWLKQGSNWIQVDRRVLQESPSEGDVFTFNIPHVIHDGTTNLEERIGISIYSISSGSLKTSAEGQGNSKASITNWFSADGDSHVTDVMNLYQTNGFLIPNNTNILRVVPEPAGLAGLVLGGAALIGRRKKSIEEEFEAQQKNPRYK